MTRIACYAVVTASWLLPRSAPAASNVSPGGEELFVRRVWPLLQADCLPCHGGSDGEKIKIKGGLDLRTGDSTRTGGESGLAALVSGQPETSPLYLASLREHDDWEPMPPKEAERLNDAQLGWLRDWIAAGAPWPGEQRRAEIASASAEEWAAEDGVTVATAGALTPEWANRRYRQDALWAYQPVKKPDVPALLDGGDTHPVDAFLARRMPEGGRPAPPADPRTLIRRATYDLTGLPPTPDEVEAFLEGFARSPDTAVRELVDRLLASPHYGERMARHWLDVVRYADTSGFANDYARGNAWRYRDYVVRSFNSDKPYDQFVREQIAGDEIDPDDPEMLVAVGFLRMGPWELTGMEVAKVARQRFLDDTTNSVGETFLAHSLQCARCHDHKFDPVPTHDYYSIQACFATTQLSERKAPFSERENTSGFDEKKYLQARHDDYIALLAELDDKLLANAQRWFREQGKDSAAWDAVVAELASGPDSQQRRKKGLFSSARAAMRRKKIPESEFPPKLVGFEPAEFGHERVARKGLERLGWEMDRYRPVALSVYSGKTPELTGVYAPLRMPDDRMTRGELENCAILAGGDPFSPTQPVAPGVLSVLAATAGHAAEVPSSIEGRRSALARWIADPRNPLTSRAVVNRIWLWHFGQAIAGNPNNFGGTGKRPTHPELLDWLAAEFVEQGGSFKEAHRLLMTSEAYRRATDYQGRDLPEGIERDAAELAYLVFKPRRLSAEELRDSMLSVSGELNLELGGIPNRPEINREVAMQPRLVMGTMAAAWVPNPLPSQRHRRTLYALKVRGLRDPFMEVFNEPAPDFSCEAREVSTVTPQVFSLFNGAATQSRALAFAARVMEEAPDDPVGRAFALAYGRTPSTRERQACLAHWRAMEERQADRVLTRSSPPLRVRREAVEENTGEAFVFDETLHGYEDFVPDLQPADVDARTRALGDVCLVILNSNEFAYLY